MLAQEMLMKPDTEIQGPYAVGLALIRVSSTRSPADAWPLNIQGPPWSPRFAVAWRRSASAPALRKHLPSCHILLHQLHHKLCNIQHLSLSFFRQGYGAGASDVLSLSLALSPSLTHTHAVCIQQGLPYDLFLSNPRRLPHPAGQGTSSKRSLCVFVCLYDPMTLCACLLLCLVGCLLRLLVCLFVRFDCTRCVRPSVPLGGM